jgi:hypothetical protein
MKRAFGPFIMIGQREFLYLIDWFMQGRKVSKTASCWQKYLNMPVKETIGQPGNVFPEKPTNCLP